ncbi:MAG TPA: amino acid permease [Caulobacteraceae bacterium]|nr:amino acid permease [Caulobacteraceae bacterium]
MKQKTIGPVLATFLVAGNMIGSGIYLLPATLASVGSASLIGWMIACAGSLALGAVFATLARARPKADSLAGWVGEGLGPFFGFQASLAFLITNWIGIVAIALAVTGYAAWFVPILKEPVWSTAATLAVIWLTTGLNLTGARPVAGLGGLTLAIGLLPILLAIGLGAAAFDPALFAASWNVSGRPLAEAVPASLVMVFWAFLGLECAALAGAVVREPEKNVPVATFAGVILAGAVYMAATAALMGAIPAADIARSTAPFADMVARVAGSGGGALVAACALVKTLGTVAGWILVNAEVSRSAAARGWLPRVMSGTRPDGVPARDILVTGVMMSAVALTTASPTLIGQFNTLVNVVVVLQLFVYLLACAALVRFLPELRARTGALAGLVLGGAFCVWAIVASESQLLRVSVAIVALIAAAWLIGPGRKPAPVAAAR